jgi:hypothetical protein
MNYVAGVGHFKTLFELSGPAAGLLKSLSPAQLSVVVEGLGRAGAKDADFFNMVSAQVCGPTFHLSVSCLITCNVIT